LHSSGCSEDNVQIGAVIYAYDTMFIAVLDFVKAHVFDPADFVIRADSFADLILNWRGWSQ
jgi:hypothetical protein